MKDKYRSIEINKNSVTVAEEELLPLMRQLRDVYGFNYLTDETAVDYKDYFEIVYNVCRLCRGDMLMIKTKVDKEKAAVPSMFSIWPGAVWMEREIYDLMGINFTGHPDMRRILLDDNFEGHPLRKDFKWTGGREV
nr:NADH-quinone oxidoreductase subunit C [Desulforadius tongensis]